MSNRYEFHMPDGSVLTKAVEVDKYYGLCKNLTNVRLSKGWTEEECANNNKKGVKVYKKYEFHMPDGGVLTKAADVDRYYGLNYNTTLARLHSGWTVDECANNNKEGVIVYKKHEFHMPDGSVLTKPIDVDRYYNFTPNKTSNRLSIGWTEQECANNERDKGKGNNKFEFHMPDGSVLTKSVDVDKYYNLRYNTTSLRLYKGWTEQECANNKRDKGKGNNKYEFHMPDGSILKN